MACASVGTWDMSPSHPSTGPPPSLLWSRQEEGDALAPRGGIRVQTSLNPRELQWRVFSAGPTITLHRTRILLGKEERIGHGREAGVKGEPLPGGPAAGGGVGVHGEGEETAMPRPRGRWGQRDENGDKGGMGVGAGEECLLGGWESDEFPCSTSSEHGPC